MIELNKKYLYHYTSFESAIKIIASGVLLFSRIDRLNDIHEVNGPLVLWSNNEDGEYIQRLIECYSQISFVEVGKRKGYDIPAMWGHYAEKGHGVCLVFDRQQIEEIVHASGLYSRSVEYRELDDPNELLYDKKLCGSIDDFIYQAKDQLFFRKSPDWSYEQEYRIIGIDSAKKPFFYGKSLVAAILYGESHEKFCSSAEFMALARLLSPESVYRYGTSLERGCLYSSTGAKFEEEVIYDFSNALKAK